MGGWNDPSVFVAFHSSQFLPTSKRMPRWENKQSKHSPHQKHYCKRPWKCLPSSIFHVVIYVIVYIYAEPNWPLFCLERTLFWRFDLPKIEVILVLGVVYIYVYITNGCGPAAKKCLGFSAQVASGRFGVTAAYLRSGLAESSRRGEETYGIKRCFSGKITR